MLKNPPSDIQIEADKLTGFWRGVVEQVDDPLKTQRVRVRIFGLHTPKTVKTETEGIPTDELPWAEPCMPIHEGSVSGYGTWSVPLQGSQVMLFFENGNPLRPMYFASLPAIPEDKKQYSNNNRATSKNDGFKDPDNVYPKSNRLGEPDVHRLARGISTDTEVDIKNNNRDTGVSIAGGGTWDEPVSPYNTQYPHNYVIATHGGILIELDSTEGSKRININHPSNTFIEIDNDGNMVVKNAKEKYEIVAEGKNIHINNQRNLTIDGNATKNIGGDETVDITGSKTDDIGNNKSETIGNNKSETIGGSKTENITGGKTETIGGSKTSNITSNKSETIGGSKTENITGSKSETIGAALTITVTGAASITAGGTATVSAPTINLTGSVNLANQASVSALLNAGAASIYDVHTHDHGDPAGTTTVPNQLMGSSVQTVNTRAS